MNIAKTLLLALALVLCLPNRVLANTDPKYATASATATVPETAPTTNDVTAPTPPILIAPFDGAVTNQTRPEFVWRQSSDPNGNTVFYTLLINGAATFLGISNVGNSQKSNYIAHLGDGNIYLTPTFDLPAGEYNWQVDAYDLSGNKSHSTTWHFTIDSIPPFLILHNLDDTYFEPDLTNNPIFELRGPKDVTLALATESYATITVRITVGTTTLYNRSYPTDNSGLANPYFHLTPGSYEVDISSFDKAGWTTTLPTFSLLITESALAQLLPPPLKELVTDFPSEIPSLVTSISLIASRPSLAPLLLILLAVIAASLLILLWYRQPNILILDKITKKPYRSLILYHSRPNQHLANAKVYVTRFRPVSYSVTKQGRGMAYIPRLGRYSTLTLRINETTHVLSLSRAARFYTIIL